MKTPIEFIRKLGVQISIYLDDILLRSKSLLQSLQDRDLVMFILEKLGLVVNLKKSVLTPSKQMEYLGFTLDSQKMEIRLSNVKAESLWELCKSTISHPSLTLRELCSLIGKLYAVNHAMLLAPLQVRSLQAVCTKAQKAMLQYGSMLILNQDCLIELEWWLRNLPLLKGKGVALEEPDLILFSDAATSAGWGAHTLGGPQTGGSWLKEEVLSLNINEMELIAAERAIKTFTRNFQSCADFHRQHNSLVIPKQNGGYEKSKFEPHSEKNLALCRAKSFLNNRPLDSLKRKSNCGPTLASGGKRRRLASQWRSVQPNYPENGNTHSGRFRFPCNASDDSLLELGTRPESGKDKCASSKLERALPLPVPTFLPHTQGTQKSTGSTSGESYSDSSTLARPIMVPILVEYVSQCPIPTPSGPRPVDKPHGRTSPHVDFQEVETGSVSHFEQRLVGKGFSAQAANIISNCRRTSTAKSYKPCWNRWLSWCHRRDADPFTAPVEVLINFLTDMFNAGLKYRTLGCYRSAISAYHDQIQGLPIGESKEISKFMSGVNNLRPPVPKFCTIWDVNAPISFLKSLGDDSDLSWRVMNQKLAALLAIVNFQRASDLHILSTEFMSVTYDEVIFQFRKPPKQHRKQGVCPPPVFFKAAPVEEGLCPYNSIVHYIALTNEARSISGETSLFLSHMKPHNAVSKDTIRRWLKEVLEKSNIDTSIFQGHSFRHASSSMAKKKGATITQILSRGGWSNAKTFLTHYNKPIQ